MNDRLLTVEQLAEELQCSKGKIRRMVKDGLPVIRISPRIVRFNLEEVLADIQEKNDRARDIS